MLTEKKDVINNKIVNGDPINLSFKFISADVLMLIKSVVTKKLEKHDLHFISNAIISILRELLANSFKANAKRIFFQKNNLNINNPQEYIKGMETFKEDVIEDLESLEDDIFKSDLTINFNIIEMNDYILFVIQNNVAIIPEEMERINNRISLISQQSDLINIYENIEDETEGAGLGLALVIMFIKNIGIDPSVFKICSENDITQTSIQVPYTLKPISELHNSP